MAVTELYHRTVPKLTEGEIVDEEIREGRITFILMEHNIVEIATLGRTIVHLNSSKLHNYLLRINNSTIKQLRGLSFTSTSKILARVAKSYLNLNRVV